jgi:hypothetical protein
MLFGYFSTLKPDHFLLSIILEILIKTIYFYAYYDPAKKTVRELRGSPDSPEELLPLFGRKLSIIIFSII